MKFTEKRIHSEKCHERMLEQAVQAYKLGLARGAYLFQWPNACDFCGATGGIQSGGSYDEPPDYDTCPKCSDQDKCPRCAAVGTMNEDYTECSACGWNVVTSEPMPPDFGSVFDGDECECNYSLWEEQLQSDWEIRSDLEYQRMKADEDAGDLS